MVVSQAGLPHTYWYHGYWYEPRPEWFYSRAKLDIEVRPFNPEQLGASAVLLVAGLGAAAVAFAKELLEVNYQW